MKQEEKLHFKIIETNLKLGIADYPIKKKDARYSCGFRVTGYEPKVVFTGSIVILDPNYKLKVGDCVGNKNLGTFMITSKVLEKYTCLPVKMNTEINILPNKSDYKVSYLGSRYGESSF